jgi:mono/diheme cytochrome c family protein
MGDTADTPVRQKRGDALPGWLVTTTVIVSALALVPFAFIARARVKTTTEPRIHPIQDMDNQPYYRAQSASGLFADGRAMRPPVPGTVARGDLQQDPAYYRGLVSDTWTGEEPPWVTGIPVDVTSEFMDRGQERYNIFCSACHGWTGEGNGPVARRAEELQEGTWTPPLSYHSQAVRDRPVGHLFNTITNGIRSMPAYGTQIPVEDRWAIVAYIRALQRAENARLGDVPPELRSRLQ